MATPFSIINPKNLETFVLIWLDGLVNKSPDNIDTNVLLRKIINRLITFDNTNECVEYVTSHVEERIVLIVSGRLGQQAVPIIHNLRQVVAIYVYCSDKKRNEIWAKNYIKVKGVIIDLKELLVQIQIDQAKRNEYKIDEPLPMRFLYTKTQNQSLIANNDEFVDFQLLIDCLCRMKSYEHEKEKFLLLCKEEYQDNEIGLIMIRDFEDGYSSDRAIWWLTRESFACRILNKAFQVINIDLLYYFHFFICDIRKQLQLNMCRTPIRTYRAQIMSNSDLKLLKRAIGETISIDTFLSTIPNRDRAKQILRESIIYHDLKRVLFEIDANPNSKNTKPFADVTSLNYFTDVELIVFMAGTIFRPVDICEENDITIIQMETCNDDDPTLKKMLDNIKEEVYDNKPNLLSVGHVLLKMKKFYYAEKYYTQLLEEIPNDNSIAICCYQGFGRIALEKKDYDASLKWYHKILDTAKLALKSQDTEIASAHNMIAKIYFEKAAYKKAVESYHHALQIWIEALGSAHPQVAECYKNIARSLEKQEKYLEAVDYYRKALIIYEKAHNINGSDMAALYSNIANLFVAIEDYNQAIKYYNAALKILSKNYAMGHAEIIKTMKHIAITHEASGNLNQALAQLEVIASTLRQQLPKNHHDIKEIQDYIQRIYFRLK